MSTEYTPVVWVDGTTIINAARLTAMQQQYLLTAGLRTLDAVPSGAPTDGSNVCLVDGLLYVWNGTAWTSSENAVAAEAEARIAADQTLQQNIDTEAEARTAADATLQTNIDAANAAVSAEASARQTADAALQTSVNSNASAITALQTTVATKANDADVLHTTGNESKTGNLSLTGDLSITGNVTQNGAQYITHAEQVQSTDDYIYLRYGATGGLTAGTYTGFEFVKYDETNNGRLVVDNTGTARVGDVGSEQPLLTRAESASMTALALMYWDAATLRALTLAAGTSGQVLQSNGSSLPSWRNVDSTPASGSTGLITSGAVYTALAAKAPTSHASSASTYGLGTAALYGHVMLVDALTDTALVSGKALASHQGYVLAQQIAAKQAALTFDTAPTSGSTNPVTSGGVYTADQTLQTNITNEATARANADTMLQTNINTRQPTVIFVTVTVPTASWSSGTQTVTVTGMTATCNYIFSAGTGQGQTAMEAMLGAEMDVTAQAANSVTLTCYGTVPTVDLSLTFAIFG